MQVASLRPGKEAEGRGGSGVMGIEYPLKYLQVVLFSPRMKGLDSRVWASLASAQMQQGQSSI